MIVFLSSCKNNTEEINKLNGELQGITDTLNLCLQGRNFRLRQIDTLNNYIQEERLQINSDSTDMDEYFSNHKAAVACIAGGYVSAKVKTDFTTEYPQTVETLAGWGIALAITYYIFNQNEVDEVINKSEVDDERKNQLYTQIESYEQAISDENNSLADISNLETTCQNRASALRQQLEALK